MPHARMGRQRLQVGRGLVGRSALEIFDPRSGKEKSWFCLKAPSHAFAGRFWYLMHGDLIFAPDREFSQDLGFRTNEIFR